MFQKLCAHPDLLDLSNVPNTSDIMPDGYDPTDRRREFVPEFSGKFLVLERFLDKMHRETTDKIVLISNFTEVMDVFEKLLRKKRYSFFRLEGSTTIKKRQKLVDQFNNPDNPERVFLLSSKAGGCGINLIGANRLILFDPDWNPASDQQALARVWRDGQKKNCFVYRFLTTGTVEEKIFQRQAHKQALSASVVDAKEDEARHFTVGDLKKLFLYNHATTSETHDTFKCKRCKDDKQVIGSKAMLYGDTSTWNHLRNEDLAKIHDDLLRAETGLGAITKVFQCTFRSSRARQTHVVSQSSRHDVANALFSLPSLFYQQTPARRAQHRIILIDELAAQIRLQDFADQLAPLIRRQLVLELEPVLRHLRGGLSLSFRRESDAQETAHSDQRRQSPRPRQLAMTPCGLQP
jgi:superfamily II DNA/RNA helicase